ncbi:MAG: tyrosine phosphatase family protein [Rhodopila sp.]
MSAIAPFRTSICGIEELADHCEVGVTHVLSILDPEWPVPEVFGAYGEHARLELRFHDIIENDIPDRLPPTPAHVTQLLAFGHELLEETGAGETHLLVHCHGGVSRSTASIALIMAQAMPDVSAERILAHILQIRPQAWPNLRILEIGDTVLNRRGSLIAAAAGLYREQLARRPGLADAMRAGGRQREVEAGLNST